MLFVGDLASVYQLVDILHVGHKGVCFLLEFLDLVQDGIHVADVAPGSLYARQLVAQTCHSCI